MITQQEKARAFQALHLQGTFVVGNAWDGGSARMLAGLGFPAIATSSGAMAGILGKRDGHTTRDEALTQVRGIVAATDLPVAVDLEKGYGDTPEIVAETIQLTAAAGAVGGSIEDSSGYPGDLRRFEFDYSVARVAAAVHAARALPFPFMLTARCENFINGYPDLDDTIRRLRAFEAAGADVLFAPGLPDLNAVRAVCAAVNTPVNFMVAIPGRSFSVAELQAAGVRRISLATSLFRSAMGGLHAAAREVRERGTFGFLDTALPSGDWAGFMQE